MSMALENYLRDLSYLTSGVLSDLTLNFGNKSWYIHKALACCHSNWFRKAVTNGFNETDSGVITLHDDVEFADAVDCMVSYFYEAGYNASKYSTSEALLHAQVAIIADKYDCASLHDMAKTLFAKTIDAVECEDWADNAAFIYSHTTLEVPAHVDLRRSLVAAVKYRHPALNSNLSIASIEKLLRSSADLATDLLLRGLRPEAKDRSEHIIACDTCTYVHVGPRDCPSVEFLENNRRFCPQCRCSPATMWQELEGARLRPAFSCSSCSGIHTKLR